MSAGATIWPILTLPLASDADVVAARQHTRRLAEAMGFESHDQVRIATAVSEIARNAVSHAGGGRVEYALDGGGARQMLRVCVADDGPGIIDAAGLLAGERPAGHGLVSAGRLVDVLSVSSAPGGGTRVVMGKALPPRAETLTTERITALVGMLARQTPPDPYAELRVQAGELMRALEEQRRQQEELSALNRELEETNRGVLALYAELEDKAVAVRQASEAKSRFLSNVSHELRTPIQSVMAIARLLGDRVDGDLAPEQERQVRFIYESARTLSNLVDDLLDLAKVEAGRMDLRLRPFEAADLIASLRGMLKPLHVNPAVTLVFDDADLRLFSDEGKIAQILRNLVSNALKFTPAGVVRVQVEHDAAADEVSFVVRDSGIGVQAADQQRIFEEFEQVAHALQRQAKGTGLGLPLARRLAHLLGGRLEVASVPGEGSVFTLRVPRRFTAAEATPAAPDASALRLEGARRALVIDDDDGWRHLVVQAARARGLEVDEARSVREGLARARAQPPDVIFVDLAMPEQDGFAALALLQADPALRDIPAVVVSGSAPPRGERTELAHALAVLPKTADLREALQSLLGGGAHHG